MNPGLLFSWLPILGIIIGLLAPIAAAGFASGLASTRYRLAPVIATGLVVAGAGVFLITMGMLAAGCPSCESILVGDETRGGAEILGAAFWIAVVGGPIILLIWLGSLVATLFKWYRGRYG